MIRTGKNLYSLWPNHRYRQRGEYDILEVAEQSFGGFPLWEEIARYNSITRMWETTKPEVARTLSELSKEDILLLT